MTMRIRQGILALAGTLAFLVGLGLTVPTFAADKGGPNFLDQLPGATPKHAFTGCGVGAYGSILNGDVDLGGFNVGANGNEIGGNAECSVGMGLFVIGAGLDYGRVFGDLNTIGVDAAMSVYGKAGVVVTTNTMLYALLAKSRLDTQLGNVDGWQFGGGVETKLPSAPLFLRLEYRHGTYDLDDIGFSFADATMDTVRLGVTYKFGAN